MNDIVLTETVQLDQNPAVVYIASLPAETGRRTQRQALQVIAQALGVDFERVNWGALRYQHTAAIRAKLSENYAPATANKMLSALRQVLKHARRLGQISGDDYDNAIDLDPIRGETLPAGRELSTGEILALMTACQNDTHRTTGTRDAAIIAVMYAAGLRRDEIVNLSLGSFDADTGQLVLTGKRNKQRTAYLTNGAYDAMMDWLKVRGTDGDALFVAINKGGNLDTTKGMVSQSIYDMLEKRAEQAGIKAFSPHDLRRTFISHLLGAGADIATVSKMAGHANVQTTARYDRRPEDAKRKAAELLHVPYKKQ